MPGPPPMPPYCSWCAAHAWGSLPATCLPAPSPPPVSAPATLAMPPLGRKTGWPMAALSVPGLDPRSAPRPLCSVPDPVLSPHSSHRPSVDSSYALSPACVPPRGLPAPARLLGSSRTSLASSMTRPSPCYSLLPNSDSESRLTSPSPPLPSSRSRSSLTGRDSTDLPLDTRPLPRPLPLPLPRPCSTPAPSPPGLSLCPPQPARRARDAPQRIALVTPPTLPLEPSAPVAAAPTCPCPPPSPSSPFSSTCRPPFGGLSSTASDFSLRHRSALRGGAASPCDAARMGLVSMGCAIRCLPLRALSGLEGPALVRAPRAPRASMPVCSVECSAVGWPAVPPRCIPMSVSPSSSSTMLWAAASGSRWERDLASEGVRQGSGSVTCDWDWDWDSEREWDRSHCRPSTTS